MKSIAAALFVIVVGASVYTAEAVQSQPSVVKAKADTLFAKADRNHDGKLDAAEFAEFKKLQEEKLIAQIKNNMNQLQFAAFDKDGDNEITPDELKAARIEARQKMVQKLRDQQARYKSAVTPAVSSKK
jgi:Ca2+-binding EF-hand superfamily protein